MLPPKAAVTDNAHNCLFRMQFQLGPPLDDQSQVGIKCCAFCCAALCRRRFSPSFFGFCTPLGGISIRHLIRLAARG
jgi:hypothetical protein